MALATLLHYSYKDYQGNDYTISLIDTQANAAGSGTEVAGRAATVQYEGDSDLHPYVPILYGKMDAYFEVPTQAVEDIIVNALTGDENRYLLHMERNGDAFFIGVVQAEQVELPRAGRPYAFKISATDGLKRLENERGAVPGDMTRPIVNNMLYFLNQSPVAALYSAGDPFMQVSSQYWEEDMDDAYTVTVDPLRRYAIQSTNDLYLEENNDGDDRYRSHLHRLKDICHAFGLQLYFQEGLYKFIQLDQKRTGTLRLHTYSVDFKAVKGNPLNEFTGTASYRAAATVLGVENASDERAGGTASFMPPVRQVNTTEKDRLRLYPRSFFSDLDSSPVSLLTIPASTSADGLQLRLDVGADAQNFSWPSTFLIEFNVFLQVGSQYYANGAWGGFSQAQTYTRIAYDPGAPTHTFYALSGAQGMYFDIRTPSVPTFGLVQVQVTADFYTHSGQPLSNTTVGTVKGFLELNYTSVVNNDTVRLNFGTNASSSYQIELPDRRLIDNPGVYSPGMLLSYQAPNYEPTAVWRRFDGMGLQGSLSTLIMAALHRGQQQALRKYDITLIGYTGPNLHRVFNMDDYGFTLMRATYHTDVGELEGTFVQIDQFDTSSGPSLGSELAEDIGRRGNAGGNNRYFKRANRIQDNHLPAGRTNAALSGDITSIALESSAGSDIANSGNRIALIDPTTGYSQELVLAAAWTSALNTLEVEETTLERSYPAGSIISIPIPQLAARLYALENPE